MRKRSYYIVNFITFYRMFAAPVLLWLVINKELDIFKWLLAVSFFTDAIDGFLARRYRVSSILGAKIDSIADDLTIVVAIIGVIIFKPGFLREEIGFVIVLVGLYLLETILALARYGKITGFHTYTAKVAALLQGSFLLLLFFLPAPVYPLFYVAAIVTALDLLEEIILVLMLPKWEANVRGLFWVIRKNRSESG